MYGSWDMVRDGHADWWTEKWHIVTGAPPKNEKQNKQKKKASKTKQKANKKNRHPILHIQVSLSSKFQLQQTISIFWKKFSKREYSLSKQKKNEHQQVSHISLNWNFFLSKKGILGLRQIKWKSPPNSAYFNKTLYRISV